MIVAWAWAALATPPHVAPEDGLPRRRWDVEHLDLAVEIDPAAGTVAGVATLTVSPLGRRSGWLVLHQVALDVAEVQVDGEPVSDWRLGDESLRVPMPAEGTRHEVRVVYRASPETGLHFRGPSRGDAALEVWSQGEDEDNRFWFPGWDYPNDRFTVGIALTVPDDLEAFAVGRNTGRTPARPGWSTWTFALERPVPNYLVAVAVGDYVVIRADDGIPVEQAIPVGMEPAAASVALSEIQAILPWMTDTLGVSYPYPLYRQVGVQRFLYGGMENPTLTILASHHVVGPEEARPWRAQLVQAHEAAHHWFGDLVTTYGWRDLWLNEGFAQYLAARYQRHVLGETYGAVDDRENLRGALSGDHPMAARAWSEADDDNASVYTQGAAVLRWAAHVVGQEAFDAAVTRYLTENADDFATSDDLRFLLEQAGGQDLSWLFDAFVHGTGHPTVSTSWSHDDDGLVVTLVQEDEGAWHFPVDVEIGGPDGVVRRTAWVGPGTTRMVVDLADPPRWVAVDPDSVVLARFTHEQPGEAWLAQASESPSRHARLEAFAHLDEANADDAVRVLVDAAGDHRNHLVYRAEAASALGRIAAPAAVEALMGLVRGPEPVLREAAVDQLHDVPASTALIRLLSTRASTDPDDRARASALDALGHHQGADVLPLARQQLTRGDLWTRRVALRVLGVHGTPRDARLVVRHLAAGEATAVRLDAARAAVRMIERHGEEVRPELLDALVGLLGDADLVVRQTALGRLAEVEGAAPRLRAFASTTTIPWLAAAAREAASASAHLGQEAPPVNQVEPHDDEALEVLRDRLDALERRLGRLESW